MLAIGIIFGFMAALCQALSYICSKAFLHKHPGENTKLLLISHALMGLVSLFVLPFVLVSSFPPLEHVLLPLFACAGFYMVAQGCLFMALKITEASRVSPLLGLKILFIAFLSMIFFDKTFSLIQWSAVGIALLAGAILNWSGSSPPFKGIVLILFACLGYSLSDINIKILIVNLSSSSILNGALCAVTMTYCLCGIVSIVLLSFMKKNNMGLLKDTIPFSIFWFVAMLFLFVCFAFISVMLGNIIQSTRGVISIVIAAAIAKAGYEHIEKKITKGVFIRRVAAAILMLISIVMFVVN
jgi:uncharacterized membrane protein